MEQEEINVIINKLESGSNDDKATFGLYFDERGDDYHIKANKRGFELFALEMLKASIAIEKDTLDGVIEAIPFGNEIEWHQGDVWITNIQPVRENRGDLKQEILPVKETFGDRLTKYGCLTVLLILILSTMVGLYTLFKIASKWI